MFGWSISFTLMKLYEILPITGIFLQNLHLHLSEATEFIQKLPSPY